MHILRLDQLDHVTGGAAPATNNLADWLPKNPAEIKSPDMRAYSNPPNPSFRTNTPMVTSQPDQSWLRGADKMFQDFGIR